jgi:hypothetical protein
VLWAHLDLSHDLLLFRDAPVEGALTRLRGTFIRLRAVSVTYAAQPNGPDIGRTVLLSTPGIPSSRTLVSSASNTSLDSLGAPSDQVSSALS